MRKSYKSIRPLRGKVILTPLPVDREMISSGGIALPKSLDQIDNEEFTNDLATVLAVGAPGADGPAEFKAGDVVVIMKDLAKKNHSAELSNGEKIPLWILSFAHVSGVMEEEPQADA